MMLTNEERLKFAQYLEELADSDRKILQELKKLPGRLMQDNLTNEITACLLIARRLYDTEHVTIERPTDDR
jgi:hypothetical protein